MLPRDSEAHQGSQGRAIGRVGKHRQRGKRVIGLGLREPRSVLKPPGRFNCCHDFVQTVAAAVFDDVADQCSALRFALRQRMDQG